MDETDDDRTVVWGWQSFFDQLSHFLLSAERQVHLASETYVLYVVEKLETCLVNVQFLKERIISFQHAAKEEQLDPNEQDIVDYADDIQELVYLEEMREEQPLSQRSNCCRSRKCIRWHIPVHAIFAVFYLFFLFVLSRPSFTSRTPNKDQKTEELFYFLLVQVP